MLKKLANLPFQLQESTPMSIETTFIPLSLSDDCIAVHHTANSLNFAGLDRRTAIILMALRAEPGVTLQLFGFQNVSEIEAESRKSKRVAHQAFSRDICLSCNVHGPPGRFDAMGTFASKCKLYWQDPYNCDRDVPYQNPHRISFDDEPTAFTQHLETSQIGSVEIEVVRRPLDLLTDLGTECHLVESNQPSSMRTKLFPHQLQALTFMLERERSWSFDPAKNDIWKLDVDDCGHLKYFNNITGESQDKRPPEFRGGILADAMGLGKTLSLLSLIALDSELHSTEARNETYSPSADCRPPPVLPTLIVAPVSLVQVWTTQIVQHLRPQAVNVHVYHGPKRAHKARNFHHYHVTLTTYHVVLSDWKRKQRCSSNTKTLFDVDWHRVVLDEAHLVRNSASLLSKAAISLRATRRWALTGTPIQNRLTDLKSIFTFLRIHPFDNPQVFSSHVVQRWKARSDPAAVAKLKLLVNSVTLRRPKKTIDLPPRRDRIYHLTLDNEERELYERARADTLKNIDTVMGDSMPRDCLNALQWINNLRLICNHGLMYAETTLANAETHPSSWGLGSAQAAFDGLADGDLAFCAECQQNLVGTALQILDSLPWTAEEPCISEGLVLLCHSCFKLMPAPSKGFFEVCCHYPHCSKGASSGLPEGEDRLNGQLRRDVSTKIRALLGDLTQNSDEEKTGIFLLDEDTGPD